MKGPKRWGGPSELAWLRLSNAQGILDRKGSMKEENLPSTGHSLHRCSENTDPLQGAAPQLEPQRHLQAYIHLAFSLQNHFWAAGNMLGAQIQYTNPARCCVADMLRQMSLEWEERSLLTSILMPGCRGRAPGRNWQNWKPTFHLRDRETEAQRPALSYLVSCRQS